MAWIRGSLRISRRSQRKTLWWCKDKRMRLSTLCGTSNVATRTRKGGRSWLWYSAKGGRVLIYKSGTKELGLWYSPKGEPKLVGFIDSYLAECGKDRRSTSGYWFTLGSGMVAWGSKKQSYDALCTCKADYIAGQLQHVKPSIWLNNLLSELEERKGQCNLKSWAIELSKNPVFHS